MARSQTLSCLQASCGCTFFGTMAVSIWLLFAVRGCMNHRDRPTGGREFSFDVSRTDDRLVFCAAGRGGSDLYMLEPNGHVTRLTDSDEYETEPRFSADGKWVVYGVGQEEVGGDRLAIFDISTKRSRYITDDGGNDTSPSFSPDGRSVTYLHQSGYALGGGMTRGWDSAADIRRIQLDGSKPTTVAPTAANHASLTQSRDGKILAWDSPEGIWIAIGSNPPRLIKDAYAQNPSISPENKLIAFDHGQALGFFVVPIAGGTPKQLLGDFSCRSPHFSGDGKWIYYLQDETIWKVRPSGHDHSRVAPVDLFCQSPTFWTQ